MHELFQALEVQAELLHKLATTLFKVNVEELIFDFFDLVGQRFLGFSVGLTIGSVLGLKSLCEHVLLQVNDVHDLFLQLSQAVTEILILLSHSIVDLILLL